MQRLRRLIWPLTVVLLPLALMAWTSLQGWRASSVLDEAQVMRQWLANPSDGLLEQLSYQERVQASSVGRADRFQFQVEQADADRGWLRLRQALAGLGFWLALAALLAGPAGWLKLRLDAWRALKSQTFLYQHLSRSWHALGRWLVAYTCLLVAALTMVLLYELSWGWSHLKAGGWTLLLLALPLAGVIYLGLLLIERLRSQWHAMQAPSSAFLGRALGRSEAPQLWAWIEQLAQALNAPAPDHIVVGVDQSFFVTSVPVALQPSQHELSGRTLYLPLTYLSSLSQAESAAIIGHELGHFSNRDTERGSEVSARFSLMCAHFALISGADADPAWIERPAIWMAAHFLHHFQLAVHHWGRQQELLADRSGAAVAGERLFCQALLRVIALDREIDQVLRERPAGNLIQALSQRLQNSVLQLGGEQLEHAIGHPFDTHPSTALRLQQLGIALDAPLLAAATRRPSDDDRQWFAQLTQATPTTAATTSKETFI
ncbi:M48 family metallopeptidase [Pseudomonas cremoricolorata]|uniref:M48 family metallopeptidase n=1 Tax=Pseudomonas cremoricolorata TaxID=157783 RepID=UPI0009DD4D08|nr:M48 family metallopeptidase [Pseudomonas cremoricolorata]